MKNISNNFRESLRNDRQLSAVISYVIEGAYFYLTTENVDLLETENENNIITQSAEHEVTQEYIYKLQVFQNASLFKTASKHIIVESKINIPVGTKLSAKIGVLVNGEYEYINFGKFYVKTNGNYQASRQTYTITAYDKMEQSMISFDDNPLPSSVTFPISHKNLLVAIFNKLGWSYRLPEYPNQNKIIEKNVYEEKKLTYRDVLDDLMVASGGMNLYFFEDAIKMKKLTIENHNSISDKYKIIARDLKDSNIDINDTIGPINYLKISNDTIELNSKKDTDSIEEIGEKIYNIENNYILSYNSENFINEIWNVIKGLNYILYDIDSYGLLCFDIFDVGYLYLNNQVYNFIILNDEITLTSGLIETLYIEKDEENQSEYSYSTIEEKKAKNAIIRADNIKLEGYTTINGGFKIDTDGNMECNNAKITGGRLDLNAPEYSDPVFNIEGNIFEQYNFINSVKPDGMSIEDEDGNQIYRIYVNMSEGIPKYGIPWISMYEIQEDYELTINPYGISLNESDVSNIYISHNGNIRCKSFNCGDGQGNYITSSDGNLTVKGNLAVEGTKNRIVNISNDKKVLLNAYETATPYFGDIGSDKTDENGYCKIEIEKIFKKTIENDYKVFIQECGDGQLYVTKYSDYFEVKGTPNLDFDWEVKSIQKGYQNTRLKEYDIINLEGR